jgi:acetate kinase
MVPQPRHVVTAKGKGWSRPGNYVGNGAYVLKEWTPNEHITLEKNPRFYDATHVAIEKLIYGESGLLGVSGVSSDMRTLLASEAPRAQLAIDLYVYRIGRELGSLAAALGGLDAIVFTGGIGENSAEIRERVCLDARWLGVTLDEKANGSGGPRIDAGTGSVAGWTVPTNEELMIARHTKRVLQA